MSLTEQQKEDAKLIFDSLKEVLDHWDEIISNPELWSQTKGLINVSFMAADDLLA